MAIGKNMKNKKEEELFWTGPGYRGEYQCPHGVGHGNHIHGCDGCCERDDFPLNAVNIKTTRKHEKKLDRKKNEN
jgi:hypothetical protein